jgi:hypothetical protein
LYRYTEEDDADAREDLEKWWGLYMLNPVYP